MKDINGHRTNGSMMPKTSDISHPAWIRMREYLQDSCLIIFLHVTLALEVAAGCQKHVLEFLIVYGVIPEC
jgi:hypothetical protein